MTSRDDIKYEIEELKAQLVKEREDFKNVKVKLQGSFFVRQTSYSCVLLYYQTPLMIFNFFQRNIS